MKSLYILYTGGTIGMTQTPQGLQPSRDIVTTALQPHTGSLKTSAASLCEIDPTWHICDPLIDSSALTPQHWANWLTLLQAALPQHDAILILHGTDTLAYTANLLALALNPHGKPIILTGAQKPLGAAHSDAPANLHTALAAIQNPSTHGVLLAFNGKLIPPVGSSKTSTEHDNGFANPHFGTWQTENGQPENAPAPFGGSLLQRQFNPRTRVVPILLTPSNMLDNAAAQLNPDHSRQTFAQHQPSAARQRRRRVRPRQRPAPSRRHQRRALQPRNRHRPNDARRRQPLDTRRCGKRIAAAAAGLSHRLQTVSGCPIIHAPPQGQLRSTRRLLQPLPFGL